MMSSLMSLQALLLLFACMCAAEIAHVSISGTSEKSATKPTEIVGLPPLPYDYAALEPFIDERTVRIHHDKHHAKYVATTKELIKGTAFEQEGTDIVSVLRHAAKAGQAGLFNNAAQSYNHALYWECMAPPAETAAGADREPRLPTDPRLVALINQAFGSFAQFRAQFAEAGATQFGSGWVWLVLNEQGQLEVLKTGNAGTPIVNDGVTALLVMDVWEHAYYLQYQNLRPGYIAAFLDHLVNWDFVASQLPA